MPELIMEQETKTRDKTQYPIDIDIILYNDDTTPFPFVQMILRKIFELSPAQSDIVTMQVHMKPTPDTTGTLIRTVTLSKASEMQKKYEAVVAEFGLDLIVTFKPH